MPNIKSQKKRVITNDKKRLANASQKTKIKTAIKAVASAVEANDKDAAAKAYAEASKQLDRSITSNIHHKNYVSRQKARLAKAVNSVK
ncbi:30S ribosomal protein S20 [Erysipelotrichaceae bacterium MTC7]|nr:30S ribosomal protein S20 [Erysipelotrichaceae bacterium MTC7]